MAVPLRRAAVTAAVVVLAALSLASCGLGVQPTVATFEIDGGEHYKIELATPELIGHAKRLLAGESLAAVPNGVVVHGDSGVNAPWSWHIDPESLEFSNLTTEGCDGTPQHVEDGIVTFDSFCPWSARVIAVEGPDS